MTDVYVLTVDCDPERILSVHTTLESAQATGVQYARDRVESLRELFAKYTASRDLALYIVPDEPTWACHDGVVWYLEKVHTDVGIHKAELKA